MKNLFEPIFTKFPPGPTMAEICQPIEITMKNQIPLTTIIEPLYTIDKDGNLVESNLKLEHRKEEVWTAEMRSIEYRRYYWLIQERLKRR